MGWQPNCATPGISSQRRYGYQPPVVRFGDPARHTGGWKASSPSPWTLPALSYRHQRRWRRLFAMVSREKHQ